MKQNNAAAAAFDLDDLERELRQAAAPKKVASSDDPLAELARIVGQDSGSTGRPTAPNAFDDFLARPAQPSVAANAAPVQPVEQLFPDGMPSFRPQQPMAELPVAPPAPVKAFDPLEALLAQDLGLRSGIDELPEPRRQAAAPKADPIAELDALMAAEMQQIAPPAPQPEPAASDVDESHSGPAAIVAQADDSQPSEDVETAPAEIAPAAVAEPAVAIVVAPQPAGAPAAPAGKFDDMMAEFEAAMRDVGGNVAQAAPPPLSPAPAQPMIAPPPGDIVMPQAQAAPRPSFAPAPAEAVIGAAGAAVIGAGVYAQKARPRRGLMLAGGVIAVAVVGLGALALVGNSGGSRAPASGNAPVIAAKPGVTKERPANPGGVEVPNQDKEILQARAAQPAQAERIAPREEQPVDLTQAQRQAAAPGQVRQIPGVAIVAPVTTTPPAGQPADPQPRPVASVPITIAEPSTAAPVAVAPPAAAQQTASAPAAAPQPAAAVPPARPQSVATEPRRVRSVSIRPENGEAAPNRAQAQPRVVATAPAAPPAPTETAPLRLSPQAAAPPAAAPRQAVVPQGTVPSSVPSLDDETPAAPAAPTRTASVGAGFAVQVAAEGSEEAARTKFARMRGQHGAVLGAASPTIRSAEVNGRSVYRVRVGNMSREEAVSMCERLKASGGSCFVARN